ncbi:GNAT family N-acetyltransferase [Halobacteria archaeon AArc-m2/3/4]|uniref:GNAT family N-acetyltransferase n=1 Tax=Natronoglomus mannanivorans TaxID=2979990 RepID=A0AAP2Z235_9EURY|nr:GNAT family N-acetyltransferase [Halobacteria archaeon AArc-xg1-1]MCU4972227.1 GNAT family N-acetyltransferase [Halobacteria archaeon AArc-m2/3/4]
MAPLRIRRYEPRDEDAVWDLHVRALSAAGAYDEEFAHLDADLRRVEAAYLDLEAGGEFLVGEYDGALVAMGGFQPSDERDETAVLRRMRVAPDHHRRGFGTAILEALEARARDDGFERIVLDTTARQAAAVAFYESHGYELWRRDTLEMGDESDGEEAENSETLEMLFYEKRLEG